MVFSWKSYLPFGILFLLTLLSFYAVHTIDGLIYFEKDYYFKLLVLLLAAVCLLVAHVERWTFHRTDLLFLSYTIYLTVNGFKSDHRHELANHVLLFIVYFFTSQCLRQNKEARDWLIALITLVGILYSGHGLLQYAGIMAPSAMSPTISGRYSNSAPFASLLIISVPLSFSFLLNNAPEKNLRFPVLRSILHWCAALAGTAAIVLTESRAAFIALFAAVTFIVFTNRASGGYWLNRRAVVLGVGATVFILFFAVYLLRPSSAQGRLLIWRIALSEMVTDQPYTGGGEGYFGDHYMHYQGQYLGRLNYDERAQLGQHVANTPYAFNEIIRMLADDGLVGVCLILGVLTMLLFNSRHAKLPRIYWVTGMRSCLLAGMVFAFFSYPLHDLTFRVLLMLVMAGLASELAPGLSWKVPTAFMVLCGEVVVMITVVTFPLLQRKYDAFSQWREDHQRPDNLSSLQRFSEDLRHEGLFALDYAAALASEKQLHAAVDVLKVSTSCSSHPMIYLRMADYFERIGNYKMARRNYRIVSDMLPYKFYPLYCLMNMQSRQGDRSAAMNVAREILSMPVKVPSRSVDQIKASARKCLQQTLDKNEKNSPVPITLNPIVL